MGTRNRSTVRRISILANAILDTHLAKYIAEFASAHPLIDVSLKRVHFEEMVEALGNGQADVAYFYSSGPVSALASEFVWAEPISICARYDHPVFSRERVTLHELQQFPFVAPPEGTHFRRTVDALFRRHGLDKYHTALETGHANIARESVIGGFAISAVISRYLAEELANRGVQAVGCLEGRLSLDVRRAVRRDLPLDREMSSLIQCLNRAAPYSATVSPNSFSAFPPRTASRNCGESLSTRAAPPPTRRP
jgi:DNA-binding transcriptional LysR family regulator